MRTSKSFFAWSLLLVLGFSGGGCRRDSGAGDNLSKKNNVVWWLQSDISRLHPWVAIDADAQYIYPYIWEPMNRMDPRTHELQPGMASLPEISEDHLQYTYTMNPAAKWSDGKPLTAADVIFSFKGVMNPFLVNGASIRGYMTPIDSVGYVDGDQNRIRFYLNKPYHLNDLVLGAGYVPIMPKHIFDPKSLSDAYTFADLKKANSAKPQMKEWAEFFESPELARDSTYQVGSGPYLYKGWITHDRITLKKNPNYWAKDLGWGEAYPEEIVFKTINDQNAAITALKSKQIDVMPIVPSPDFVALDTNKHKFIRKDTVFINQRAMVAWNNKRPMFEDKRTRQALSHLIDIDQVIHLVLKDMARRLDGPVAFTQWYWSPTKTPYNYDQELAKRLLDSAGWKDTDGDGIRDKVIGGKKTPFSFLFSLPSGNEVAKSVLLVFVEQLRKVGIEANVTQLEWSVLLENLHTHNFDATMIGTSGNAGEDDLYQQWHSSQSQNKGSNYYSYKNPEVDGLLEQIRVTFDRNQRKEMLARVQDLIREDQPVTFMWVTPLRMARIDRFDNVEFFRQRPGFDPQFWVVRGSGMTPMAGRPSTVTQPR